jgi:uncharacterized membrane protein
MSLKRSLQGLLLLSLAGLGVSLYLAWVYTADTVAVCFGNHGCDLVQHSPYAWIGGIPVPALGAAAYVLLAALAVAALRLEARRELLLLGMFGVGLTGVLFSAYLTYLELFVIHAICTWCVVSAVIMVAVFSLSLLARRQWSQG